MWASTATIFFFSAVVVFLISVIASTLTSAYQTRQPSFSTCVTSPSGSWLSSY